MAKIDDSVKKKVPELRFSGFTDDWEERKLGEIGSFKNGMNFGKDAMGHGSPFVNLQNIFGKNIVDDTTLELAESTEKQKVEYSLIKGDVLFIRSSVKPSGVGEAALVDSNLPDTTYSGFIIRFRPKIDIDNNFKRFAFGTKYVRNQIMARATSSANTNINQDSLSLIQVGLPNLKEQEKIGSFFKQLDATIALHQRKLDLLKEQKKGYLQKMFPKNGAKVPELRFAGFADDWEDRKLSSIAERVTRKNKNNESTLPLTISAQDGLVDQNDYFNKQVASRDVTGYFLVKNGEFAYNKSYSNGYPWGAIKRLDKYEMGVLSTLYIVFKPTAINSQFLVSYYETTRWYREVSKNAAEGARNHGLLNISPNDFFNTLLTIPKSAEEQQQIGSFFKQLDDTIALHQRKLDLLKEQKKGFLQKMFV